jgi:hypothetical protein
MSDDVKLYLNYPLGDFPLPNERLAVLMGDSPVFATVIGSVYYYDDNRGAAYSVVLLLPTAPFFATAIIEPTNATDDEPDEPATVRAHHFTHFKRFANIVEATDDYQQIGGDL